jgi:3-oxoacyl-[acyl-carrier protein] reductase
MALLKAFAEELGKNGIRVNSIAPGYVRTDKLKELQNYTAEKRFGTADSADLQKVEESWANLAPLNRILEPSEIASLCLFLFSDLSSAITGQTILADAGQLRLY